MTKRIQHKRSSVAANIPSPSDLEVGELALNFADRYIYTKNGASAVIRMSGHVPLVVPNDAVAGDSYINVTNGKMYVYFDLNGAGEDWVEIAPPENLSLYLPKSGGTMTGHITVFGTASGDQAIGFNQVTNVVDTALAGVVQADGSVAMTGHLELVDSSPSDPLHAASKGYVDNAVSIATPDLSDFLPKSGGVMTGQITLPGGGTGNQAATANELAAGFTAHVALPDPHTQYTMAADIQLDVSTQASSVGGTADAIELTFATPYTGYVSGMRFRFRAGGANTVTAPTIKLDALGTKTIKRLNNLALEPGSIAGAGHICDCVYNGTDVILLNPTTANNIGKHTIFIPAGAMKGRVTAGASALTLETTTNKVMRQVFAFDSGTREHVQAMIAAPKSWNAGTVTARVIWEHPATTTNFDVVWAIEGLALDDDDSFETAFGTAQSVTDTGGTTLDHYKTAETAAITLNNTPAKGNTLIFQIYRDAANGADTLAVDAYLVGVEIYYTVDATTDA